MTNEGPSSELSDEQRWDITIVSIFLLIEATLLLGSSIWL